MNYNSDYVLHEPCHRTLKPTKEILIQTPKSPEHSPNHVLFSVLTIYLSYRHHINQKNIRKQTLKQID